MRAETLSALLMDRELGELSLEARELLEAYLSLVPSAQSEAGAVARAVNLARETVCRFPDLARPTQAPGRRVNLLRLVGKSPWLMRAAAVVIAAASAGLWVGYQTGLTAGAAGKPALAQVGRGRSQMVQAGTPRYEGLWTRYRVAYDDARKGFAVEAYR